MLLLFVFLFGVKVCILVGLLVLNCLVEFRLDRVYWLCKLR